MKYKKVIIWGYPLYSHTHSYVHEGYYRAFQHLGYETHWFHDGGFPDPKEFDYSNTLFIGEGFADNKIPINASSCYCIMYCPSPQKYAGAGRYIDIRMAAYNFKDHIQEYSLDKEDHVKVGPACYFASKKNQSVIVSNDYVNYTIDDYDKLYISWATNKLPHEFNFDDINLPRQNVIHYPGSIGNQGLFENMSNFLPFMKSCRFNNVKFIHNCPWGNPLTNEEVVKRTQESLFGVDIRGPEHIRSGLLTCRTFKNISHGQLAATNSSHMYQELDGLCIYNPDTEALFYDAVAQVNNKSLVLDGMKLVQDKHTYINRTNSIISIL